VKKGIGSIFLAQAKVNDLNLSAWVRSGEHYILVFHFHGGRKKVKLAG
jgi:hypothetical protein